MDSKEQIPRPEESLEELDMDATSSVDDFIRELEAKEKDLHITSDMRIEIADSDFDEGDIPVFVQQEISAPTPVATAAPSAAATVGMKTRVYELENEIEKLHEKVRELRTERNEIQEKSDRRLKDFENYKYRMDRERRGAFIDQISNLASQMLPVLDNLDRALDPAEALQREKSPEFQQFYDGIALVNQQVNEVFAEMGVQPITPVGLLFDPNFHEAVAVEERDDIAPNTIIEEMLRGYRIGNRVIRHSMVKVTTAPAPARLETVPDDTAEAEDTAVSPETPPVDNPPELDVSIPGAE